MKKIYLATPYSHPLESVRRERFELVNIAAAKLMLQGYLVFSPISHTHPISEAVEMPQDWDFWEKYDRTFIEWADEIHVLKQYGWEDSIGVTAEIKLAEQMGKPVVFIELTSQLLEHNYHFRKEN